ncbi:MAG: hypothetical protein U0414_27835 [Polyangiaceae bacterium]
MLHRPRALLAICITVATGCTSPQPKSELPASSEAQPPTPVTADVGVSAPLPAPSASGVAEPLPSASAAPEPSIRHVASAEEPLPNVEVKFYGLHVGGGKNDKAEHAPIIASVNRHLDDFKRCFAKADDKKKGGTYGIQLLIPGAGGKAEVSLPKSGIKGDEFKACMLETYTNMEFDPPKGHIKTNATYSVIFTVAK